MTAASALAVVSVDGPPFEGSHRMLEEARLVEGVCVNRDLRRERLFSCAHLDVVFFGH